MMLAATHIERMPSTAKRIRPPEGSNISAFSETALFAIANPNPQRRSLDLSYLAAADAAPMSSSCNKRAPDWPAVFGSNLSFPSQPSSNRAGDEERGDEWPALQTDDAASSAIRLDV
jgi:hypothetical protein